MGEGLKRARAAAMATQIPRFKKGQKVTIEVHVAGLVTTEDGVVLRVDRKGAWLDNGVGNDPSGPFDATTGWRHFDFGLGSQRIRGATDD